MCGVHWLWIICLYYEDEEDDLAEQGQQWEAIRTQIGTALTRRLLARDPLLRSSSKETPCNPKKILRFHETGSYHQMQSMEDKLTENDCWLIRFIILFQILQLSHAHNINCTVTQGGGWTLYAVQRMEEAKACLHSWINMTGHVLANHNGQINELVETNTNYSLRTRKCFPVVRYEQNCLSEESLREAYCNTNCSEHSSLDREEGNTRHHWITLAVIVVFAVGLFLSCIFKNRLSRHEAVENQDPSTLL